MTAYNINNVARLMNEDAAKYNRETGKFEKNEEHLPGGHNAPSIANNAQPTRFKRVDGKKGKLEKTIGSGKGKEKAKENPFAKKDGNKENLFAKKTGKKVKTFAKKDGKKANPFAKGGSVEESIDRLLYLLEASDQSGMSEEEHAELERRVDALPPKYVRSANPGPALAAQLASSERTKAHLAKTAGSGAVCRACGQKILPGGRHDYPSQR